MRSGGSLGSCEVCLAAAADGKRSEDMSALIHVRANTSEQFLSASCRGVKAGIDLRHATSPQGESLFCRWRNTGR